MKQVFLIENFEIELPDFDSGLVVYYDVSLVILADVTCRQGVLPTEERPGEPEVRTILIEYYRVVSTDGNSKMVSRLNEHLHANPLPALAILYDAIWDEFILSQEDEDEGES